MKSPLFVSVLLSLCLFRNAFIVSFSSRLHILLLMLQFILLVCHVRAKNHRKHYLAALRHADGEAEGWTEAGAEVYSCEEMRHLAQNQYLPWTSSVMKIPHGCRRTTGILCAGRRGYTEKPAHPSVVEGGVNKGIACTFFTEGGVGGAVCLLYRERWTRTTCLPERAAEGRQASAAAALV